MREHVWLETGPYYFNSVSCMTLSYTSPTLFSIISQYSIPNKHGKFVLLPRQIEEASSSRYQSYIRFAISQLGMLVSCSSYLMKQKKEVNQQEGEINRGIDYVKTNIETQFQKNILPQLMQLKGDIDKIAAQLDYQSEQLKSDYIQFEEILQKNHQAWQVHRAEWNEKLLSVLKNLGVSVSDNVRQEIYQLDALAKIKERFNALRLSN